MSSGKQYLCGSSAKTSETTEYKGKSYPSVKVSISSSSHPFFTGDSTFVDTEGRVDKFKKRYAARAKPAAESAPVAPAVKAKSAAKAKPAVKAAPAAKAKPSAKKEK